MTLVLVSCTSTTGSTDPDFEFWYDQVINEPYDPENGSKY